MTEPLPPLSDEDLSAALDGMAGPDVEARIQADPSALARLGALRAASEAIGDAPTVGPEAFDALIIRAIEVGTDPAADARTEDATVVTPPTTPDGVVTPLAPRRRVSAGAQRWLVAAAVVALVAIGLGLVYSGTRDNRTQTAATGIQQDRNAASGETDATASRDDGKESSGAEANDHAFDAAPGQSGAEAVPELEADAMEPADLHQLGSFEDVSSLRTMLRAGFPQDAPTVEGDRPNNAAVTRCNDFIQTVLGDVSLSPDPDEVGQATVDGDEYLIYEFSVTDNADVGSKLITAAEPQSCDLLFTFVR